MKLHDKCITNFITNGEYERSFELFSLQAHACFVSSICSYRLHQLSFNWFEAFVYTNATHFYQCIWTYPNTVCVNICKNMWSFNMQQRLKKRLIQWGYRKNEDEHVGIKRNQSDPVRATGTFIACTLPPFVYHLSNLPGTVQFTQSVIDGRQQFVSPCNRQSDERSVEITGSSKFARWNVGIIVGIHICLAEGKRLVRGSYLVDWWRISVLVVSVVLRASHTHTTLLLHLWKLTF